MNSKRKRAIVGIVIGIALFGLVCLVVSWRSARSYCNLSLVSEKLKNTSDEGDFVPPETFKGQHVYNFDVVEGKLYKSLGMENNLRSHLRRVCYFRMDPMTEIRLSQVDGKLCTHVIMAFARIDTFGNLCVARDEDLPYLAEVPEFKRRFPATKVMISVFNEAEYNGFPRVAIESENREIFARSSIKFLQRYHLDGIDLDWEFPNFPATFWGKEYERIGQTRILESLRLAIDEDFSERKRMAEQQLQTNPKVEPYLLTMAVAAQDAVISASYELQKVADLCDWLNMMGYDYYQYQTYAPFTRPNSPLYPIAKPYVPVVSKLSIEWTLCHLLEQGIDKSKIVMGIPTYARAYRLMFHQTRPTPFSLSKGPAGGKIDDYLDYREVLEMLRRPDTVVEFDQDARVPYLLADSGYLWVSYENPQSIREKLRFILRNQLAGYMTWNLNSDDFIGANHDESNSHLATQQANGHTTDSRNNTRSPTGPTITFPLHRAMLDEVRKFQAG